MRWLLLILILLTGGFYAGYRKILVYPNELYLGWLKDKKWDKYYSISQFNPIWMRPSPFRVIPEYREDYAQLWKEFPLRNIRIPLPVRHPLFLTVPILESEGKKQHLMWVLHYWHRTEENYPASILFLKSFWRIIPKDKNYLSFPSLEIRF